MAPQLVNCGNNRHPGVLSGGAFTCFFYVCYCYLLGGVVIMSMMASIAAATTTTTPTMECTDTSYCDIQPPSTSLFRFPDPPSDGARWRQAQIRAANGEQVLLKRVVAQFPHYLDYLDGDITFRQYNKVADLFLDEDKRDMLQLSKDSPAVDEKKSEKKYDFHKQAGGDNVLPPVYQGDWSKRAPIVKLGYFAYDKRTSPAFDGPVLGEAPSGRGDLLRQWKKFKDKIDYPFISLHAANENWGMLSTYVMNRTVDWGRALDHNEQNAINDMLASDKVLMFIVNQHYNMTHPKLISFPRGMPIFQEHQKKFIFDTQRKLLRVNKKENLVFTSTSSWGPRPRIMACISAKFTQSDFTGSSKSDKGTRYDKQEYLRRLGSARFGLALAGLGYDTFRLWETMNLGSVAVLEKGIGLEKSVYRLPALIVEDFDVVTPQLLRTAYIEAIYRADEFEFERLKQSWWWSLMYNVSTAQSTQPMLDKFPPAESEDSFFTRPFERYDCWETNSCGSGTKRIPKNSC